MNVTTGQRLGAEFIGTLFLLATIIGSGIMAETLADGNVGVALLGNTIAIGAILVVFIWLFGPVSGAHFNPAVTLSFALRKEITPAMAAVYVLVQVAGGIAGALMAHLMFDEAVLQTGTTARTGAPQWFSEMVATFGLVFTVFGTLRYGGKVVAIAVGLYITAAIWFTASTSFANPAVTIARSFTDTFTAIAPAHVPPFIAAQLVGAVLATVVAAWLFREQDEA